MKVYSVALLTVMLLTNVAAWCIEPLFLTARTDYEVGNAPLSDVASDIDGDGDLDIISLNINQFSLDVSILINDGDGSFFPGANYSIIAGDPETTFSVGASFCAGDLDNDGDTDLVVAAAVDTLQEWPYEGRFTILYNNGAGSFWPSPHPYRSGDPLCICAVDMDGDGYKDLVTAMVDSGDSGVYVFFNTGSGNFANPIPITMGIIDRTRSICGADFNADGYMDLAVCNLGDGIWILPGPCVPNCSGYANYAAGDGSCSMCAADLDGDGDTDLAVANNFTDNMSVLLNNGDGTFAEAANYGVGDWPSSIFAADFDGDGANDLAITLSSKYEFAVCKNNGDGTFGAAATYAAGSSQTSAFASDFDGDGSSDLVVSNFSLGTVSVFLNNGEGEFGARTYAAGGSPTSVFGSDLDGDGDQDLAIGYDDQDDICILKNNGDAGYEDPVCYPAGTASTSVFASDLNGDGYNDLIIADTVGYLGAPHVLMNQGDGTFGAPVAYWAGDGGLGSAIACDVDDDGDNDLAVSSWADGITVLKNDGSGTFSWSGSYATGDLASAIVASDLDNDGDDDLAALIYDSGNVSILINDGDGIYAATINYTAGAHPLALAAADLDGDGDIDLAIVNDSSADVSILKNDGNAVFGVPEIHTSGDSGNSLSSIAASDFDGDGDIDLAMTSYTSSRLYDRVYVLENIDNTSFSAHTTKYFVQRYLNAIFAADYDGDGDDDLAVTSYSTGRVAILINLSINAPAYLYGDANGDEAINVADAVYLINFIFKGGPPPSVPGAGDANCDGATNIADAVYLINYIFKGGPEPDCP